jgi:hypothetical protein
MSNKNQNNFFNVRQGFSSPNIIGVPTNIINTRNFDEGTGAMDAFNIGLQHSGFRPRPKLKAKGIIADPTRLMLSPDASGGGGGGGIVGQCWVNTVGGGTYKLAENRNYDFVINNTYLPNGYKVGGILDKNQYQINKNKTPVVINGQISGKWIKFYPTLMHLGYQIKNREGVISITSPASLVGYEVPLVFVKKI